MFIPTITQMSILMLFMAIGFVVTKTKIIGPDAAKILAKLENTVFIPALVLDTFRSQFTVSKLQSTWKLLVFSTVVALITIPIAMFLAKIASKDSFVRKVSTYGLLYSNFSFMGNAVVKALYGEEFFMHYFLFTLPLWILIYMWAAPAFLMGSDGDDGQPHHSVKDSLKTLLNPMIVALLLGIILGLSGLGQKLPNVLSQVITTCSNCMSPIAMILTGITFAGLNFKKVLSTKSVYIVSAMRLLLLPFTIGGVAFLVDKFIFNIPDIYYISLICVLSMPLGLNSVIVPAAYGRDTSVPAGMALVSHVLSIATIPLVFSLLC